MVAEVHPGIQPLAQQSHALDAVVLQLLLVHEAGGPDVMAPEAGQQVARGLGPVGRGVAERQRRQVVEGQGHALGGRWAPGQDRARHKSGQENTQAAAGAG